jgi:hypothetical protein
MDVYLSSHSELRQNQCGFFTIARTIFYIFSLLTIIIYTELSDAIFDLNNSSEYYFFDVQSVLRSVILQYVGCFSVFFISTFSHSTFSLLTFSHSAFSLLKFSHSTFSLLTFSLSMFSPSIFGPLMFSPLTSSVSTFKNQ